MAKTLYLSLFLALMVNGSAFAQSSDRNNAPPDTSRLLRGRNITSTGATVPHPGVSQGAGTTPLDRAIQKQDDQELRSICTNCGT